MKSLISSVPTYEAGVALADLHVVLGRADAGGVHVAGGDVLAPELLAVAHVVEGKWSWRDGGRWGYREGGVDGRDIQVQVQGLMDRRDKWTDGQGSEKVSSMANKNIGRQTLHINMNRQANPAGRWMDEQ